MTTAASPTAAVASASHRRHASPHVPGRARARGRSAASYRRRRAVAGLLVATAVGVGVIAAEGVLTGPGGVPASAAGAGTASAGGRVVRADAGDSLWSIAERHAGEVPITRYVDELIDLNGGTVIEVGQLVRLP